MIIEDFSPQLKPIIRIIDDWFENRNLALAFEAKVGNGKLLITSIDLISNLDKRPAGRQLLYSLKKYMDSESFSPENVIDSKSIKNLFQ